QLRLFVSFVVCVAALILMFKLVGGGPADLEPMASLLFGAVRLAAGLAAAGVALWVLVRIRFLPGGDAKRAYVEPFTDFVTRYGKAAFAILSLIGLYRIADVVMGAVANVFYLEMGFEIAQIATYSKFFCLVATLAFVFLGVIVSGRIGVMRALFAGAVLSAASNLMFAFLATQGTDIRLLVAVITTDNLSAGFAVASFVAYMS